MRVAALDLGTNTFLLLIADVGLGGGNQIETIYDEARVVRLGQAVNETKRLHPDALKRAEETLAHYAGIIAKYRPEKIRAYATSAARDAANSEELLAIGRRHGIPIEIVSGEREAETTFWGTIPDNQTDPVLIIDVGGGSTEFILGDKTGLKTRRSLDIGAVRLTELMITMHPVPQMELTKMREFVEQKIQALRGLFTFAQGTKMIAVAGTPTTLAAVDQAKPFDRESIDGYKFPVSRLQFWANRLAKMTVEERQALPGMEPKRADVLVAGVLILIGGAEVFGLNEMEVSTRGLRYGLARRLASGH